MSDFSKHYFCVAGNGRLAFEGVSDRVGSFISDRLTHFGARYELCTDLLAVEVRVRELLARGSKFAERIVVADMMNPFCDMELVSSMSEVLNRTGAAFSLCEGAVPGTGVITVLDVAAWSDRASSFRLADLLGGPVVRWETQARYNNQLNLYKYKRVKLFLALTKKFPDLHSLGITEFMEFLTTKDAFSLLTCFGDDLRQLEYAQCPHCEGHLSPLVNTMSQPFCGYLPNDRPLYKECESCGLVVQSPSIHEDDVSSIYDKWDKQDFIASANNPYNSNSIRCDFSSILKHLPDNTRSLDLGGGVGNFTKFLHQSYPNWEVTHSDFAIKAKASDGVNVRTLDFTRNEIGKHQYELITAWEVIEHVPYHKLSFILKNIWEALTPGGFFVFSTPDFDSPLCKSFDFFALCPPFHYLVFGQRWLQNYFTESLDFEIFEVKHCSDFLDDAINWYDYARQTAPSMALRGTAELLHAVFKQDEDKRIRNHLTSASIGTEIVMTLRKKPFK